MKKILSILLLANSFLYAMDNQQELIERLKIARRNPADRLSETTIFNKTAKSFFNVGNVRNTNSRYWQEIEKGNFIYVPFYSMSDVPESAIIVGTKDNHDKEVLEAIFKPVALQGIGYLRNTQIYEIIKRKSENTAKL